MKILVLIYYIIKSVFHLDFAHLYLSYLNYQIHQSNYFALSLICLKFSFDSYA